jgi:N-acetylmuramoyl-L-alanine amidase
MKKLLVTMLVSLMLTLCIGTTVYASELSTAENQLQNSTEVNGNANSSTTVQSETVTILNENSTDNTTETTIIEDDTVLEEGYYIDEQGQVYYEKPEAGNEEPVIVDIEEDTEDEEEVKADKPSYSEKELRLLSSLIYAEAGGQSYEGMLAVANVVINRSKSKVFWHVNSIEQVIYDHKWSVQFSVTIKNKKSGLSMLDKALKYYDTRKFSGGNPEAEKKAMNRAIKAAKAALQGKNNIGNYLCFTNKRATSSIKKKYPEYRIIGDHIFYRTK